MIRTSITTVLAAVVLLGSAATAQAAPPHDGACQPGDSGKVDVRGDHETVTVTAPEGSMISGYCVKAGSAKKGLGPEYVTVEPTTSITFGHSSGKDVSHYSVIYVDGPDGPGDPGDEEPPILT